MPRRRRPRMTDERLAARAAAILEDALVVAALDGIEAEAISAWRRSRPDDAAGRERAWLMLQAAERFRAALALRVTTAALARARRA